MWSFHGNFNVLPLEHNKSLNTTIVANYISINTSGIGKFKKLYFMRWKAGMEWLEINPVLCNCLVQKKLMQLSSHERALEIFG